MIDDTSQAQHDLVKSYLDKGLQIVTWPDAIDPDTGQGQKGPKEKEWNEKKYTIADYKEGYRVGLKHGIEVSPGKFAVDIDIDWGAGVDIAMALLPMTQFLWGRASKRISHCFYTCPDIIPPIKYEDIKEKKKKDIKDNDKGTTFIEFRSNKHQVMAPPSVWEKDGKRETLRFLSSISITHIESSSALKQRACLAAIGMILAKYLGKNGFGHDARLAWAGFLLRASIPPNDLIVMGEAMSGYCSNTEVSDVRRVVESTVIALNGDHKKVKGGPALAKMLGERGGDVIKQINGWLGRDSDFIRNREGLILPKNQENIRRAVEMLEHELSYDDFAGKLLIDNKPMEDKEVNSVLTMLEVEFHFQPPENYFERIVKFLAWQNSFHPVKDYLSKLRWDGVPRVDTWLVESGDVKDSAYTRAVSSIMLVAAVRRIHQPGAKYDEMVVWESSIQGKDKSSAAKALCPNPAWFSDDLPLNAKSQQLIESTLGKWIIEASDLAGKRKTEIEQLKAMLSRAVDGPARMAYAHFPVERPRHWIIIGTTNSKAYLTDPTGSRRFWPLTINKRFDIAWILANRDQIWAEASAREQKGESIRLHESLWPIAAMHQEARREVDAWEVIIRKALLKEEEVLRKTDGKMRVPTVFLWEALGIPVERRDRYGSLRVTDTMTRLGFTRAKVRPHGEELQVGFAQEQMDKLNLKEEDEPENDEEVPF